MRNPFRSLYRLSVALGFDPVRTIRFVRGLPFYFTDLISLVRQSRSAATKLPFGKPYPCLDDRPAGSGQTYGGHYLHQDLLVARRIFLANPRKHVDVGSRIDGFITHVASFRSIEVIDIRPSGTKLTNVQFIQGDLTKKLDSGLIGYCDSLSCLHALEHFGLGRYGDPIDYDGHLHGLANLGLMLAKGGTLYVSTPIGPSRIEFNSQRVFSIPYLRSILEEDYEVRRFCYVDDSGELHEDVGIDDEGANESFQCRYGCGIFELTKK